MAITRLAQTGAELNLASAELSVVGDMTTSSAKARTGTYSFQTILFSRASSSITLSPVTAQFRAHLHLNHVGLITVSGALAYICRWTKGATQVGAVAWDRNSGNVRLLVGSTTVAEASAASIGIDPTNVWHAIGVDVKLATSGGWIYLYKEGELKLYYNGNTLAGLSGIADVDAFQIAGGLPPNGGFNNSAHFDDIVIDDTTGEAAPAPVPDRRFALIVPNGNGDRSEFTGSDGNQIDNYLLVDEIPPNDDIDYVRATSANLKDLYNMTTATPPTGFVFGAVIALAYARKAAAEDDTTVTPMIKSGSTEQEGTAQTLGTSYALRWSRFATDPNTGAPWTQSGVDGVQVGVKSGGTYS